jgi:hypothetical protein
MQLTPRTRTVAAVVVVAVAVVLGAVASGRGCTPVDATAEGTARAFVSATRGADRRAAWALLGPSTQARLGEVAKKATARAGGARRFAPIDMLDVGAGEGNWAPTGYRVHASDGMHARVEILGPAGARDELELVRVSGKWRVELAP